MPAMVPVYFQLSRWLYGYFQNPDWSRVYHDATAINYITTNVPNHPPGILDQLPNPAANPVSKQGIAADGLNVGYIQAADRNNQDLLQRSCGDPGPNGDRAGQNNGRTSYAQWQSAFHNLFANDAQLNAIAQPIFGIIDTNSAHHLSAPLVERAVTRARALHSQAVVVINFDMHPDYGTGVGGMIGCQGWGWYVSNIVQGIHAAPLANAYVRLGGDVPRDGQPITWDGAQWHQPAVGGLQVVQPGAGHPHPVGNQVNAVLAAVAHATGVGRVDAYVSIDRDLVQKSFTQYDDGKFTWADAFAGVQACLAALQAHGSWLIGFDVCGLPTHPGVSSKGWVQGARPSTSQAIQDAAGQVVQLWNQVLAYP
jgi:hypothetical protein